MATAGEYLGGTVTPILRLHCSAPRILRAAPKADTLNKLRQVQAHGPLGEWSGQPARRGSRD
jgi:hypothetical protein